LLQDAWAGPSVVAVAPREQLEGVLCGHRSGLGDYADPNRPVTVLELDLQRLLHAEPDPCGGRLYDAVAQHVEPVVVGSVQDDRQAPARAERVRLVRVRLADRGRPGDGQGSLAHEVGQYARELRLL